MSVVSTNPEKVITVGLMLPGIHRAVTLIACEDVGVDTLPVCAGNCSRPEQALVGTAIVRLATPLDTTETFDPETEQCESWARTETVSLERPETVRGGEKSTEPERWLHRMVPVATICAFWPLAQLCVRNATSMSKTGTIELRFCLRVTPTPSYAGQLGQYRPPPSTATRNATTPWLPGR